MTPGFRGLGDDVIAHHAGEESLLLGSASAKVMTNAELVSRFVELGLVFCFGEFVLSVDLADHFPSPWWYFGGVEVLNRTAKSNIEERTFVGSALEGYGVDVYIGDRLSLRFMAGDCVRVSYFGEELIKVLESREAEVELSVITSGTGEVDTLLDLFSVFCDKRVGSWWDGGDPALAT